MDFPDHLEALRHDGAAFAVAASGSLGAGVPGCPGWTVADLVHHLGTVHRSWATIVAERRTAPPAATEGLRPRDDALLGWYGEGLDRLVAALDGAEAATPVWTWTEHHDVGTVARRMAHETALHRWDADDARGTRRGIAPELAADGIDELLHVFTPFARDGAAPLGGTAHLHCTDVPGEWMVRPGDDGSWVVSAEHAKGDVALRGRASDLLLVLWRRLPLAAVEVLGDAGVGERLVAHTDLG